MKRIKSCFAAVLAIILLSVHSGVSMIFAVKDTDTFTTGNGAKYFVKYDSDYVELSEAVNNALVIEAKGGVNTANSAIEVKTETMYPILSASFDIQCSFGSLDNSSYFGFEDKDGNQLLFRVTHYATTTTLHIVEGDNSYICGTYPNRLRTRVYNIGVTQQAESFYITYDGIAVTGEGYSDDVKEALKLENTFLKQALANDAMFHFVFGANSLNKHAYISPDIVYADGYAVKIASRYNDRNCGTGNLTAVEQLKNATTGTSVTYSDGVYDFSVSKDTVIGLVSPVNANGFYLDIDTTEAFYGYYTLANDLAKKVNPVKFTVFSAWPSNPNNQIFANHAATTNVQTNGDVFNYYTSDNAAHGPWKLYIDASNKFAMIGPVAYAATVSTSLDCSALSHATNAVYFEYYSTNTDITFKIDPGITSQSNVTLPDDTSDLVAVKSVLDIFYADKARFAAYTYDDFIKATELLYRYYSDVSAIVSQIEQKIETLPSADELNAENYTKDIRTEACGIYVNSSEFMSEINLELKSKLDALIEKLIILDPDLADGIEKAESFAAAIAEIGEPDSINVENYIEKSEKINKQRQIYDGFDSFLKSKVEEAVVTNLIELESKLPAVKAAYDVVELIKALPEVQNLAYEDKNSVFEARTAYNNLEAKNYVVDAYLTKLTECETAMKVIMLRDADWYSVKPEVDYSGDNENGYVFTDTTNIVSGDTFATTTKKYNMVTDRFYWVGMACGSAEFMTFGLSSSADGQQLSQTSTENVCFMLRPYNTSLLITFFDANGEAERIGTISNFNASGVHTFEFEKVEDHWYLKFDGTLLNGFSYARLDDYMDQYGENTHISIGGRKGFKASGACIRNKENGSDTGDWVFSLPYGCSSGEQDGTHNVSLKKGSQAVYQKKIEQLDRWDFTVNLDVQSKQWGETVIGFLKDPAVTGNYECSEDNGVIIKFINRPIATDFRTHVLLVIGGQNITFAAKEPAILDAATFNISVEKNSDRHYYIRINWNAGSLLVKYQRSNPNYSRVQLDDLVENGCYLTIGTNNYDINATVNMQFKEQKEDELVTEDTKKIIDYILEFEKNYDLLRARSVETYKTMQAKWFELDFMMRNSVIADLMDDEAAYNLLMNVIEYEDGDLDEYYAETEETELSKKELEKLIKECKTNDEIQYVIIDSKTNEVLFDSQKKE